jgi:tight adherence protein C
MRADTFRTAAIAFGGLAAAVTVYTVAVTSSRAPERLGRRGKKRMAALAREGLWTSVEPIVRWLGVQIRPLLPNAIADALDRQIMWAGDYLGLLAEEYVALMVLGATTGALFGAVIDNLGSTGGLAMLGFGGLGLVAPYLQITGTINDRFLNANRALPYAVDLLSLGMGAGLDFPGSLRQVIDKSLPNDALTEELEYTLQMLQLGHTRRAALLALSTHLPTDPVREFVQTVAHAEEKGHPLADVLAIQAQVSRQRRSVRAEELAAKAGVKMMMPLGFIFLSLLILIAGPIFINIGENLANGGFSSSSAEEN